jgi:hypothetical protein
VRSRQITWRMIVCSLAVGGVLFLGSGPLLHLPAGLPTACSLYVAALIAGYILLLTGGVWLGRLMSQGMMDDPFNNENESFEQESRLITNPYSVNIPTRYYYKKRWHDG